MAHVRWQKEALARLLDEGKRAIDEQIIPLVVADMKRLAPVDTGNLRDSIEALGGGRIGISADYAAYVEFGTTVARAQPFVRPAIYRKR